MSLPGGHPAAISTYEARHRNLAAVLEAIREQPGRSRKEIGGGMPFSLQTMTNVVSELLDMGLIEEVERPAGRGRGNPHRGLRVRPDRAFVLGMQIRWNVCLFQLLDLTFDIVDTAQMSIRVEEGDIEAFLSAIVVAIAAFLDRHRDKDVWAIGLAGPLPMDIPSLPSLELTRPPAADQRWITSTFFKCRPDALRARIEASCGLPVTVVNNSQAAALAQAMELPASARFAYVLVGIGLSASLASQRSISRDVWRHGGELGYVKYRDRTLSSMLSVIGLRELLDIDLASGALEAELERLLADSPARFDPWLDQAGPILRFLVNFTEAAIWPDGIVVGGFVPDGLLDLLIGRAHPLIDSVTLPDDSPSRVMPRLSRATRGARSIPLGAAVNVLSFRANPDLPQLFAARRLSR